KSKNLPNDSEPGSLTEPRRPKTVPISAQWLGGIGEGAWFILERDLGDNTFSIIKYAANGNEEYRVTCASNHPINPDMPHQFTYYCHHKQHRVMQYGKEIVLKTIDKPNAQVKTA